MLLTRPFVFLVALVVLPTLAGVSLGADFVKPLPNSSQFQLSNLRQEQDDFGNRVLVFDFKRTKKGDSGTYFVKGKTDRGSLAISAVLPGFQPSGSMRLRSMFPSKSNAQINLELYVTSMHTVGEKAYVYSMVSNPIRIGNPGDPTRARDWSVQEKEGYEKYLLEKPKTIKRYDITTDIPSDSVKVPYSAKLTKGQGLKACYQSKWSPITALAENADGSVFVRWDEWGPTYDCNMLRSQLIIKKSALRGFGTRGEEPIIDRLWTDATGKFKVQAKLIEKTSTMVTLLTEAGKTVKLSVSKLSEADQDFLTKNSTGDANPFE